MGQAGNDGHAISIVVADDEPHVVTYLETVLHLEGFIVSGTASDRDGAVQQVEHLHPDVVLLDLHMPGGGLAAAQLIGSLRPDTRIVIFSAEADEPDLLPLLRSGIDGYVVKGSPPDRLAEAIRSAVVGGKYLAPEVNKVAISELTTRLHTEQQAALHHQRQRSRVGAVIAERQFTSVLQPIVDLRTGAPFAVEALTRFTAVPQRPPDEWFAEASEVGLGVSLELSTARAAIAQLEDLRTDVRLAVNLSPAAVLSGRLAEILVEVPVERIIVELTEHDPVLDYATLNQALEPWRRAGARLAIDDTGGGYASFSHILNLHPDLIKLDVSLTREIQNDRPRQALARALVEFAVEMGVDVVAEGIETAPQLEVIVALGAPYAQGFHLGRPRPLDEQPHLRADAEGGTPWPGTVDLRAERRPQL